MQVLDIPRISGRARLAQLIRLYEAGMASDLMERTLYKLFYTEAAEEQKAIQILRDDLDNLEARFGMDSADFYARYQLGEMGDDMDIIEWASLYQMYMHSMKRLEILTGAE